MDQHVLGTRNTIILVSNRLEQKQIIQSIQFDCVDKTNQINVSNSTNYNKAITHIKYNDQQRTSITTSDHPLWYLQILLIWS